jgi:hypothetical protein
VPPKIPRLKDDRKAAGFWAAHDSTPYGQELREVILKVSPALRRRVAAAGRLANRTRLGQP